MQQLLETGVSYTHAGEFFSKLLFLSKNKKHHRSLLHIIPNKDIQKKYLTISQDLNINYKILANYHDLSCLINDDWIFCLCIEDIQLKLEKKVIETYIDFEVGVSLNIEQCTQTLHDFWFEFHEYQKDYSFMKKWDTLTISYPKKTLTISFWWDEIESISNNNSKIEKFQVHSLKDFNEEWDINLIDYLRNTEIFLVLDGIEFHESFESLAGKDYISSSFDLLPHTDIVWKHIDLPIQSLICKSVEDLKELLGNTNNHIQVFTRHYKVIKEFCEYNNFSHIQIREVKNHLLTSFVISWKKEKKDIYICDDILSSIFIKKRVRKKLSADVDLLLKIQKWDHIVHIDHGIWVFEGIVKKELWEIIKEYLEISYLDNGKLFVPITEVKRVSKYVWSENPKLTPLSGKIWEKKMKKIHEDIREIAEWILKNFAERKLRKGEKNVFDTQKTEHFQSLFPYMYTPDQELAIEDIHKDMQSDKNMDRLLVWDVWFWKTEIAFNAAYLSLINKKQVLFISPLVVLAHEHYSKTLERFKDLGFRIEVLTRLQSQRHATSVIKGLEDGSIDMVIGTHRLLSDKLKCKNLGLMIVDEEHKFGVVDKEKIKNMRSDIDILSLSATPIPRSLNLALSGVRDISLLKTPPRWRRSIETSVIRYNEQLIQEAWKRELERGWQIFFVHNRLSNIEVVQKNLESLFPRKKVIITHGQLPWDELEDRILAFKEKKYDILLSTTVIENGIDFSNVNTIFINECQSFGISQIHQLRWRVGRSDAQWYCYLLYRKDHLDGEAAKRIQTIVDYSYLGAGFELAMKDLEIRWWWDILGVRQSGQAKEIWVSLFLKMLEEKIEELKNNKKNGHSVIKLKIKTQIDLMISASIPDNYFLSETDKLNFYRELELIENVDDLEYLKNQSFSNNLDSPEIENLFTLLETQIYAQKHKIQSIKKVGINYQIDFISDILLEDVKAFLALDKELLFQVVNISRLRTSVKGFENDIKFIKYLACVFTWNATNPKVRLVKKKHL